jgi:hypothetical protein
MGLNVYESFPASLQCWLTNQCARRVLKPDSRASAIICASMELMAILNDQLVVALGLWSCILSQGSQPQYLVMFREISLPPVFCHPDVF